MIMAAAVILWWPLLSPLPELPRAPYPVQMLYIFVVGMPMVVVAIFISMADGILYPYYVAAPRIWEALTPRADQHLGGLIMWIPGGLVFLIALSVVFFRWQAAGGDDVAVAPTEARRGG
jgi:putative membrane protein